MSANLTPEQLAKLPLQVVCGKNTVGIPDISMEEARRLLSSLSHDQIAILFHKTGKALVAKGPE